MNRQDAYTILNTMVTNPSLIVHCKCVAFVMEAIAMQTQENKDDFFIAGLLHDSDYEKKPEQHPNTIVELLTDLGETEIAYAISAHGTEWGKDYRTIMDRSLVAVDELTGLVYAVARLRPEGLNGLTVESVLKKFRNEKFAAGVSRIEVNKGCEILGVKFENLVHFIIGVLQIHSVEIGMPEYNDMPVINVLPISKHKEIVLSNRVCNGKNKDCNQCNNCELGTTYKVELSEQQKLRYQKRKELIDKCIDPYPGTKVEISHTAKSITDKKVPNQTKVHIAGRLMVIRIQGKAGFLNLEDESGTVQMYFNAKGENALALDKIELLKRYIDRGDILSVTGFVFETETKITTVHIQDFTLLTKTLRPLPFIKEVSDTNTGETKIYDAFNNTELRYRQRYVDLMVNPKVRDIFRKRTTIIDTIRNSFNKQEFLEVQTPILQPIYGGATARPFTTHHNTLDMKLYLRIANELYLKRLIVGGYSGVYEFSVDFRNEGMSRFHNPEFMQVELYVAYKDYNWMMDLVENTIEQVAINLHGSTIFNSFGHTLNFKKPWKRLTMRDAILERVPIDIEILNEGELRNSALENGLKIENDLVGKGKMIDEIFGHFVEPYLIQPTFITSYPVELSPLAKRSIDNPEYTDRFEGFVCGKEFCNAFSELNDPVDQRSRFEEQLKLAKRGDKEAMMVDEDFLRALEYGMPPTAGLGLGIDRLTMIMLDKTSIQEVILFPQMKPEF